MLNKLARSLAPGGTLVVTGFTSTFLTPRLILDAGLVVVTGSVAASPPYLDTGFGRFHMWVMRRAPEDAGPPSRLYAALANERRPVP